LVQNRTGLHQDALGSVSQPIDGDIKDLDDRCLSSLDAAAAASHSYSPIHRSRCLQRAFFWSFAEKRCDAAGAVFACQIRKQEDRYAVSLGDLARRIHNGVNSKRFHHGPRR
jgi:hypothetical protein